MELLNNEVLSTYKELNSHDSKSLIERALKHGEEHGEMAQAVLCATNTIGCSYKKLYLPDVCEEAIDSIIVALSIIADCTDDAELVNRMYQEKIQKWQSKCRK